MADLPDYDRRSGEDRRDDARGGRRAEDAPAPLHTLTTMQRQLLEAIAAFNELTAEAAGANYLARRLQRNHTTIREHLEALYHLGWLRSPNSPAELRQPLDPE